MGLVALENQEPVTSLLFAGRLLYAGVGSFVKIFDWAQGTKLGQRQVFAINKVHGIATHSADMYVVWGGSSYAVVRTTPSHEIELVVPEKRCKDWIVDICVGPSVPGTDPTMYIQTAHNEVLEVLASTNSVLDVHRCDERSILYSGKLFITAQARWAASGTVFGGVVVWDIDTNAILHTFTAHEGSIFDVAWSPDGSHLASCSDDRAIYIWSLAQGCAVAQGWGHTSRIWRLRFASPRRLVSTAEDLTARVWEFNEDEHKLECSRIFSGHKGRNVWSCALNGEAGVAATGGGDGRIMLWDLDAADETRTAKEIEWDMDATFDGRVRDCAVNAQGSCVVTAVDGRAWIWHGTDPWIPLTNLSRMPLVKAFGDIFISVTLAGQVTLLGGDGQLLASANLGVAVLCFHILTERLIVVQATPPAKKYIVYDITAQTPLVELETSKDQSVLTCAAVSHDGTLLCAGTRNGSLTLYSLSDQTSRLVSFRPKALGSNNAVTAVQFATDPFVTATSRSSNYGKFSVPDLSPLLENRARRRGSVEGFTETADGLVFWGFQNDIFHTWNASLEFEISSTVCGGAHRSWNFTTMDAGQKLRLCYVRSPRFIIYTAPIKSPKFKFSMLQSGTHGREIRGLERCPTNPRLIAMGSEDTFVSIGWVSGNQIVDTTMIRNGHISGIQSLHWDPSGSYLFTGAGQGELVMWGVKTVGQAIFAHEIGRMPSARGSDLYDLRVMDFSILGGLIAVAYSDSSFRVWKYGKEWTLLLQQRYRECCLLNIDALDMEGVIHLLISSTDGHLAVYKLTDVDGVLRADLVLRHKVHQSGIRDSVLLCTGTNQVRHYSGGDDNALRCLQLIFDGGEVLVDDVFGLPDAHSSSITALCINTAADMLLTTSSDQKLKTWSLDGELLESKFSDVSDTGVLVEHEGQVVAGGLGVQFFQLY